MFIWVCQSTGPWVCCVSLFMCLWVILNQSTSKKPNHVSDLSKLDASLHKTRIKVLRLHLCTSMISLSKIAHQMWRNHPFSPRNKTTEWAARMGIGGDREGGVLDKNWKRVGRQYGGGGGPHTIGGLGPVCQLWCTADDLLNH